MKSRSLPARLATTVAVIGALAAFCFAQDSGSYSWGAWGSLSYTYTTSSGSCGPEGKYRYELFTYSNYIYTGPNGKQYPVNGRSFVYQYQGGEEPGCPITYTLNYTDYTDGFEITATGGSASLQLYGALAPRYQLLSLLYAPPGHASYVDYSGTTTIGTSTGITKSFTSSSDLGISIGLGYNSSCGKGAGATWQICGTDDLNTTSGSSFTQESDSSTTDDVSLKQGYDVKIEGPQPNVCLQQTNLQMDDLGLDHDYDQFIVWLNPAINFSGDPSGALYWTGYSFDGQDPSQNIQYVLLSPAQLKDPGFPGDLNDSASCSYDPSVYGYLQRSWDTSGTPGGAPLTAANYQAILAEEPWANDPHAQSVTVDTNRYTGPLNSVVLQYQTSQVPTSYQACYNSDFATQTGEKDSCQTQSGWTLGFSMLFGVINAKLTDSSTITSQSGWSSTDSSKVGQCATVSITGPPSGSGYSGPTEFNVYQDSIFGTLMIYPVLP